MKIDYRISLNKVRGHQEIQQFQKSKTLNNVPFLCTKLFQKRGYYSRGDIIQGRTLIKEIRQQDSKLHKTFVFDSSNIFLPQDCSWPYSRSYSMHFFKRLPLGPIYGYPFGQRIKRPVQMLAKGTFIWEFMGLWVYFR